MIRCGAPEGAGCEIPRPRRRLPSEADAIDVTSGVAFLCLRIRRQYIGLRAENVDSLRQMLAQRIPGVEAVHGQHPDSVFGIETRRNGSERRYVVYQDRRQIGSTARQGEAVEQLLSHLQVAIAASAKDEVFVHAGVVGWAGCAIVLPGYSYSGKTTLVLELLRRGGIYYSDEYAIFGADGKVQPFPRLLRVRDGSGQLSRTDEANRPAVVGTVALPVGLMVFTQYRAGSAWKSRLLTPGNALLGLLAHTLCARTRPQEAIRCLKKIATTAPAFQSPRGESEPAADQILQLMDQYCGRICRRPSSDLSIS